MVWEGFKDKVVVRVGYRTRGKFGWSLTQSGDWKCILSHTYYLQFYP